MTLLQVKAIIKGAVWSLVALIGYGGTIYYLNEIIDTLNKEREGDFNG